MSAARHVVAPSAPAASSSPAMAWYTPATAARSPSRRSSKQRPPARVWEVGSANRSRSGQAAPATKATARSHPLGQRHARPDGGAHGNRVPAEEPTGPSALIPPAARPGTVSSRVSGTTDT
ncbi:hypothetical protein GA0115245_11889 [Streptomyces sp. di188]|nr:hypothetical protein GA0115238_12719 [Streptomyces sp. di50b]SCE03254.1 hypothetical protein GA0115245_11889 [Streptomyces sp. di188]